MVLPAPVETATYESSMSSPSKMMLEQGNEYQSIHSGQHGGAYAANPSPAPPGYTGILDEGLRAQAAISPIDQSLKAIQGMSDQSGGRRRSRGSKRRSRRGSRRGSRRMRGGSSGPMEGGAKRKGSRRGRKSSRRTRKGSRRMRGGSSGAHTNGKNGHGKNGHGKNGHGKNGHGKNGHGKNGHHNSKKGSGAMHGGAAYSIASAQNVGAPGMLLSPGMERDALGGMNPEWKLATDPNSFAPHLS